MKLELTPRAASRIQAELATVTNWSAEDLQIDRIPDALTRLDPHWEENMHDDGGYIALAIPASDTRLGVKQALILNRASFTPASLAGFHASRQDRYEPRKPLSRRWDDLHEHLAAARHELDVIAALIGVEGIEIVLAFDPEEATIAMLGRDEGRRRVERWRAWIEDDDPAGTGT